jgi:hypothetical protein
VTYIVGIKTARNAIFEHLAAVIFVTRVTAVEMSVISFDIAASRQQQVVSVTDETSFVSYQFDSLLRVSTVFSLRQVVFFQRSPDQRRVSLVDDFFKFAVVLKSPLLYD